MPRNSNSKVKKVTITMKSVCAAADSKPDLLELITEGELSVVEHDGMKGFCVAYDDTEATGFEGSRTIVCCYGESLATMERKGMAQSALTIESGRKHHCHYGTEYGDMLMGIYTHRIINKMTENGGELYFKYTIDVNSALLTENEIYMDVQVI